MKKVFSILLIVLMVFCCACQSTGSGNNTGNNNQNQGQGTGGDVNNNNGSNGNNPDNGDKEFDRYSILERSTKVDDVLPVSGSLTLRRIYKDDYKNADIAKKYVDAAYEALEELGSKAKVRAIYYVALGLAGSTTAFDPIYVFTDDSELNKDPIFAVPMYTTGEFQSDVNYMGLFRASDVSDNDYIQAAIKVGSDTDARIRKALGFDREDTHVLCDCASISGFNVSLVTDEFTKLYENCVSRYFTVRLVGWSGSLDDNDYFEKDYVQFVRIKDPDVNSFADLTKYLKKSFSEGVAQRIMSSVPQELYSEKDGHLYCAMVGMGGSMDIESISPRYAAINGDGTIAKVLIECKRVVYDDNWENVLETSYEEYAFTFEKQESVWKCTEYVDIPFGLY